jgi:hypothetical protein
LRREIERPRVVLEVAEREQGEVERRREIEAEVELAERGQARSREMDELD